MEAEADYHPVATDPSPAKTRMLFIAALVSALLGLTLLDVAPSHTRAQPSAQRSIDCIVASAIFAGVSTRPVGLR